MSEAVVSEALPNTQPKVDPETLVIRASPIRAIRFKRGLIVALAAAGVLVLVSVAWFALKPHVFHIVSSEESTGEPGAKAPADALSALPKSYGDVPKLGQPLPGDLGGPILQRQQQLGIEPVPVAPADTAAQSQQAERERLAAELKAARQSGLLIQSEGRGQSASLPTVASVDVPSGASGTAKLAIDPERDPNAQQRNADFVSSADKDSGIDPHLLAPPASRFMLSAGSVIAGSLITGIRSDLPGLVTAQVTENVFDSATGRTLLVPQGARLLGSYDSLVAYGQKRALVVWQRILFPDGSSLAIDNVPASEASGYAGLADKVDGHSWALMKGALISTLLGVGAEVQLSGGSELVQALRQSTQQNVAHAGDQLTSKNLNVQPTITIRPGTPVRLVVRKDLILAPWRS